MMQEARLSTILVAIDFSETGESGIAWASEIARAHGARIVLCHALWPAAVASPAPEFMPLPARFYDDLRDAAERRVAEAAAALRATGLAVTTALAMGAAADVVLAEAKRSHADLVVAGTRGLTGWKKLVLGSTAARLVRRATCPVLTVHPSDVGRHRAPRTVLVPTDFSENATLAAEAAARLAAPFEPCRVVLLHAYHVPVEFMSPMSIPVVLEDSGQVETAARIELQEVAARLRPHVGEVETRIVRGYPPEVILDEAKRLDADLIAMGTHGRSGMKRLVLGSTAERVLPEAPCPVLTLHREPLA
jgi:nucleotide-binding universal stress UspA family protein